MLITFIDILVLLRLTPKQRNWNFCKLQFSKHVWHLNCQIFNNVLCFILIMTNFWIVNITSISGTDPGGAKGTGPPKIEHLNFWYQPSFYPAFYFNFVIANLYFLISLFSISFFNYNWKMNILIVYLSLICIYSIMLIFSHLSLIIILNKICFYPFRSSHWEIFYKIATSVLHQC